MNEPTPPTPTAPSSGAPIDAPGEPARVAASASEPAPAPAAVSAALPILSPAVSPGVAPAAGLPAASPAVARLATPRQRSGGTIALVLGAVVAVGGLAFALGRVTAPAATAVGPGAGQFPGGGGFVVNGPLASGGALPVGPGGALGPGALGGVTISGTVTAVGDGELTIETSSGTEVTIPVDDSTAYHAQADASSDDVTTGTSVDVVVQMDRGRGPDASPNGQASPDLQASAGVGGSLRFGTASDVTITSE